MKVFCISYDLRNSRDYQRIQDELNRLKGIQVLESVWTVKLNDNETSGSVRDHFRKFIDSDDGLFVAQINSWGTHNPNNTPHKFD